MEINLSDIVWPVSVLRCHEALKQLQPGEGLTLIVCDPGVVENILLLIKSQPELRFKQCQEAEVIPYHCSPDEQNPTCRGRYIQKAAHERS